MEKIYIDGIKTRQKIAEETGKANGIEIMCREKGVCPQTVNRICVNGYGTQRLVIDLIKKGIPLEVSTKPVPCRVKKEYTSGKKQEESQEISENTDTSKQITLDDVSGISDIELKKAEWHILNALKDTCETIIKKIDEIQKESIYKSIFGGEA